MSWRRLLRVAMARASALPAGIEDVFLLAFSDAFGPV